MNTAPRTESIQRHADTDAAIRTVPNGKRAPTTREGRDVGCVPTLPNERHELLELRRASNITIHTLGAPTQKLSRSLLPAAAATVSHPHRAGTAHSARRGRTAPARPRRTAHPCGHLFPFVRSPPFLRVHRSIKQSTVSWHPPALPSGFAAPGRKGCTLVQRTFAASCDRCIVFVTPTYIESANVCHRRITRALAVFV